MLVDRNLLPLFTWARNVAMDFKYDFNAGSVCVGYIYFTLQESATALSDKSTL